MKELTEEVLDVIYADLREKRREKDVPDILTYLEGVDDAMREIKAFLDKP